jgi:acetolactate synthase I/II/III large subunit
MARVSLRVAKLTVAEAVSDQLWELGVDRVFGLPGGEVLAVIDALRRRGIEFVVCRHEADAGIMAGVYGRLTQRVGVVLTTLGPGACNLTLPLASSLLDREPLLAISAQVPASWPIERTHQRLPLLECFGPLTKMAGSIDSLNCRTLVTEAARISLTHPQGPTFLCLSAEDAGQESQEVMAQSKLSARAVGHDQFLDPTSASRMVSALLEKAEHPLVVVGTGTRPESSTALRGWLERWGLPVAVTPKSKGMVDEAGSNFIGVVGGMALETMMLSALRRSDCIIGFGLDPVEIDGSWHTELPVTWVLESSWATGAVPRENLIGTEHGDLLGRLSTDPPRRWEGGFEDVQRARAELLAPSVSSGELMSPLNLVEVLNRTLPSNTVVATDVGAHKYLFGQFWKSHTPQTFLMSNGLSGMGYGLPAAIAAKLVTPTAPVLAVVGDGAFSMNSQELETAVRVGARFVTVVLADNSYSLIELSQKKRGLDRYGVDFGPIDSVKTAEACGVQGLRSADPEHVAEAVAAAFLADESLVIEVPIDAEGYRDII